MGDTAPLDLKISAISTLPQHHFQLPDKTEKVPKKRRSISMQLKRDIILGHLAGKSLNDLKKHFDLPRSTILCITKRSEEILTALQHGGFRKKRMTKAKYGYLEGELYEYYKYCKDNDVQIGGEELKIKAKEIAERMGSSDFRASSGWLGGFKKRFGIAFRPKNEENETSEKEEAIPQPSEELQEWLNPRNESEEDEVNISHNELLVHSTIQEGIDRLESEITQETSTLETAEPPPPTAAEALQACSTLIRYVNSTNNQELIKLSDAFSEKLNHQLLLDLISENDSKPS
ncbi:unnamed protein product [Bursaphelenchus xylophilus]|uniref:(pine wood nematode) hypothetical protein n=1 Tax=Bursaphelenchus xylophilus TaxID=6326 RepID=A0A1I7RLQ5_BURXY|nr:unnamed protein product [Bursaphelenchus xylophilus]CAG9082699.1 unnamed protein product [Bursaphelenchus xylophilus]